MDFEFSAAELFKDRWLRTQRGWTPAVVKARGHPKVKVRWQFSYRWSVLRWKIKWWLHLVCSDIVYISTIKFIPCNRKKWMPIASPLPFLLYAKSWLLTSSDHLMSSLPLYNSLEYSWWIWKWEAKSSANSISACHFHCSLFIVLQCTENFSPAEKISYSFVLSPCFLFVLHLSVINPHPQHSLSKTAFLHTDLELCSCTQQQSTSPQKKNLNPPWPLHVCLESQPFSHTPGHLKCRHIMKELIILQNKSKTIKEDKNNKPKYC